VFSLPPLNEFLVDRVWIKAYPWFFRCIRIDPLCRQRYEEWKQNADMLTLYAFRLYRTLDCVRLAKRKGYDVRDLDKKKCLEVRRYGEQDYWDFEVTEGGDVVVDVNGERIEFKASVVDSVRLIQYPRRVGDRIVLDKYIYLMYNDWLRVAVRPYAMGFEPPLLRVFVNAIERTREEFKVELPEGWHYVHGNWIPLEALTEDVIRRNHELAFDPWLKEFIRTEWRKWFLEDIELAIRISQVEIARDVTLSKDVLMLAMHGVGGPVRTLKHDVRGLREIEYHETDIGNKYYITVRKGLQVKVYTKAIGHGVVLNRLEYTVSLREDFDVVKPEDVFARVGEVHEQLVKALLGGVPAVVEQIREKLKPLVHCNRRGCDMHYAFLFDLFLTGCIKGSRVYSKVVQTYKQYGLVKTKGRGRNAVVCLNESVIALASKIRREILDILGAIGIRPFVAHGLLHPTSPTSPTP